VESEFRRIGIRYDEASSIKRVGAHLQLILPKVYPFVGFNLVGYKADRDNVFTGCRSVLGIHYPDLLEPVPEAHN